MKKFYCYDVITLFLSYNLTFRKLYYLKINIFFIFKPNYMKYKYTKKKIPRNSINVQQYIVVQYNQIYWKNLTK